MTGLVGLFLPWDAIASRSVRLAAAPASAPVGRPAAAAVVLIGLMLAGQLSLNVGPPRSRSRLCRALGLYQHAIFTDWHFRLPGPLLRFSAVGPRGEIAIPSFDERGCPTLHDRHWKLFGFTLRARGDSPESALRYVRGWLECTGTAASQVRVYCRDARVASLGLDFGADDLQRRRPWVLCGVIAVGAR